MMTNKLNRAADWLFGGGFERILLMSAPLALFYLLTAPGNLTEADDVYTFAKAVETCGPTEMHDPRLLLYHAGSRIAYRSLRWLGFDISGLETLRGISAVFAGAALVLFGRLLRRGLGLDGASSLITVTLLAFSYGFWRYAAEGDVYAMALFCVIGVSAFVIELSNRNDKTMTRVVVAGLLGGISVLVYQPNVVPLFAALPVLFFHRERWRQLIVYVSVGGATVIVGYVIAFEVSQSDPLSVANLAGYLRRRTEEFSVSPLSLEFLVKAPVKATLTFAHNLLSTNWVFGLQPLADFVKRGFSYHFVDEEIFAARQAGSMVWIALATLPVVMLSAIRVVTIAVRTPKSWQVDRRVLFLAAWLLLVTGVIVRLNPTALEVWTMVLPPFFAFVGLLMVEPCVRIKMVRVPAICLAFVVAHNWIGGMGIVWNADSDYERQKASWLVANTTSRDVVVVAGGWHAGRSPKIGKFIRYRTDARVVQLSWEEPEIPRAVVSETHCSQHHVVGSWGWDGESLKCGFVEQTWDAGGRVFVFEDFFELPGWSRSREQSVQQELDDLFMELRARSRKVFDFEFGATFELLPDPITQRKNGINRKAALE